MAKTELMVIPQTVREALATRSMTEAQWNTLTNVLYPGASPATALLVWMAIETFKFGKPTIMGAATGAVLGGVAGAVAYGVAFCVRRAVFLHQAV